MSGATLLSSPKKIEGPVEKRLALEDHRPIVRSIGVGQVVGAWFIAWALTVEFIIPEQFFPEPPPPPHVIDPDPPVISFDGVKRDRTGKPVKQKPHKNTGPKASSPNPSREEGRIQVKTVDARTGNPTKTGYELIREVVKGFDVDKLAEAAVLTKTDPTRLSGRPGIKREEFNQPYGKGDGTTNEIDIRPGRELGSIRTTGPKGTKSGELTQSSSIDVSSEGRFRSSPDILKVVRAHTPGLRHLYNTYLRARPGMGGKVTVRFAISPSGRVVDAGIDRSTTGVEAFEEKILAQIRTWRFDAIKATGNDIVTVPFNFSE